jgi:D-amino-acid dehydrogenase
MTNDAVSASSYRHINTPSCDQAVPRRAGRKNERVKITVVGAGVIGLSCAYELSSLGHEVTVIDAGAVGAAASAGNAGWVTPFLSTPRAAPGAVRDAICSFASPEGPARMRPHLEPGFASWVVQFLRASGKHPSGRSTASLQAFARQAHSHFDSLLERGVVFEHYTDGLGVVFKDAENLDHYGQLVEKMRSFGYVGDVSVFRGREVAEFDPAVRRGVAGVMHLRNERHVRPESLTGGLAKAIEANGGQVVEHDAVVRITRRAVSWLVDTADTRQVNADQVVLAAAYGTRELLRPLGIALSLEAAKGTSMTAYGEGTVPSHPLKFYENLVACSPFGNAVRLSGTFDIGRRDSALDRKRLEMVVRQGLSYLEDWRPTDVEVEWVGHRPTSVDDLPIIGPVPGHEGLYVATGHGTLGVTLGPVTGALAAREISERAEQPLLAPFRLTRFRARTSLKNAQQGARS